ncbi:unnamed protein product [Polarella glacialis]|uniref:Uncharacterized protein n=1 Tax=Polarella glacialis TaxID=89957 RepID=A0A813LP23_POLGL|nr:unnamed protein product [Polarella glacialis]CAE8739377.1 unnamed protein product [Polarella glacialis]
MSRPPGSAKPLIFTLLPATGQELTEAGLARPGEGGSKSAQQSAAADDDGGNDKRRTGFRLVFPPTGVGGDESASVQSQTLPEPKKVLRVGQGSQFLPLAKAIATELRWLPEGSTTAVETILSGKAKNNWARTYRLADCVAQVYRWQVAPAKPGGAVRPFRCIAEQLERPADKEEATDGEVSPGQMVQLLRLTLIPEGPPPPRPDGSPGVREKASEA